MSPDVWDALFAIVSLGLSTLALTWAGPGEQPLAVEGEMDEMVAGLAFDARVAPHEQQNTGAE